MKPIKYRPMNIFELYSTNQEVLACLYNFFSQKQVIFKNPLRTDVCLAGGPPEDGYERDERPGQDVGYWVLLPSKGRLLRDRGNHRQGKLCGGQTGETQDNKD